MQAEGGNGDSVSSSWINYTVWNMLCTGIDQKLKATFGLDFPTMPFSFASLNRQRRGECRLCFFTALHSMCVHSALASVETCIYGVPGRW
jgi:hypothetical protein